MPVLRAAALLCLVAGCALPSDKSTVIVEARPTVSTTQRTTALAGTDDAPPLTDGSAIVRSGARDPHVYQVDYAWSATTPKSVAAHWDPVAAHAHSLSNPDLDARVQTVPTWSQGVKWSATPSLKEFALREQFESQFVVMAPGSAAVLSSRIQYPVDPSSPQRKRPEVLELELRRSPGRADDGLGDDSANDLTVSLELGGPGAAPELLRLHEPWAGFVAFSIPLGSIDCMITVIPAPNGAKKDEALERAAAQEDLQATKPEPPTRAEWSVSTALIDAFRWGPTQRQALVRFAHANNALLTRDFALVADEALLESYAAVIRESLPQVSTASAVGPHLEQRMLLLLAERLDDLPPEMESALTARCGAAARHASSLEELARPTNTIDALDRRIENENLVFLRASDAADRTRAFDWLTRQGQTPLNYDPLAPRASRDAALRAMRQAAAQKGESQP